jgi:anti-sigma B factor antagonist
MESRLRKSGDVTIVDLEGDLVIGDGDEVLHNVLDEVLAAGARKVLVNLAGVSRMDSSGIGELVSGWKLAKRHAASVRLLRPGDRVRFTLHLTQVLPLIEVYEDEQQALAAFAAS